MSIRTAEECEVPKGWHPMIRGMLESCFATWPSIEFKQVKEKYGMLRVYFEVEEEYHATVSSYVGRFENISKRVCADCGAMQGTKIISKNGWLSPYCERHQDNV